MNLLTFLATHVYSCKFGTFLKNSDYEWELHSIKDKSISIWSYINDNFKSFMNPFFWADEHLNENNCLNPCVDYIGLWFWWEHFYKNRP